MKTLNQIRAIIDAANPITNRTENGANTPLTLAERDVWLDAAAKEAFGAVLEWQELRSHRNSLLSNSDWTQVSDADVDKTIWAAYRQELRDLPAITDDPRIVAWPSIPRTDHV